MAKRANKKTATIHEVVAFGLQHGLRERVPAVIGIKIVPDGADCIVRAVDDPAQLLPEGRVRLRACPRDQAVARFAQFTVPRHFTIFVAGEGSYSAAAY
jgi:hypothetical protein